MSGPLVELLNNLSSKITFCRDSWRLYAKSTVSRDLLLKGAMTLRGDGVVEGEIKGQVFSHGDDELVKGETGFEAISDTDDEGDGELCCGNDRNAERSSKALHFGP